MSDDKTTTDNQTNSQDNAAASDQSTKVTVYSTSWCAFCHTEMEWLKKLGIDFVAKDIEADPSAKEELLSKNGGNFQGVPVTDVCGEIILGFDRPKLQDALRKNGLIAE
jgi:glutaredoxin